MISKTVVIKHFEYIVKILNIYKKWSYVLQFKIIFKLFIEWWHEYIVSYLTSFEKGIDQENRSSDLVNIDSFYNFLRLYSYFNYYNL